MGRNVGFEPIGRNIIMDKYLWDIIFLLSKLNLTFVLFGLSVEFLRYLLRLLNRFYSTKKK